ncbi:MAG: hypothetical protein KA100_03925 [Rickettsiales bacterium]|nr:hypothetical protein [Rickettsiales bacterium]
MKNTKITQNTYAKFLAEIQNHVDQSKNLIVQSVTRHRVEMAWKIGQSLNQHLLENSESDYGKQLFKKLENDVGISTQVLYKMRSFYQAYPKLPKDDAALNWSHYRVLAGIKKTEERKYLEDLTRQNSWDSDELQTEAVKVKTKTSNIAKIRANKAAKPVVKNVKKLLPMRGKLFSYPLIKLESDSKTYVDCGFGIFREWEEGLPTVLLSQLEKSKQIVDISKKDKNYSLKKSQLNAKKINVYKAFVTRVVDGDTLHVVLDLGFKLMHQEILRLKGIDAPEIGTQAGKKSARKLSKILKNVPFVIVKSFRTDIYGRFVADIFLAGQAAANSDPQQVADEGVYLNQLLLDLGAAERF